MQSLASHGVLLTISGKQHCQLPSATRLWLTAVKTHMHTHAHLHTWMDSAHMAVVERRARMAGQYAVARQPGPRFRLSSKKVCSRSKLTATARLHCFHLQKPHAHPHVQTAAHLARHGAGYLIHYNVHT